MEVAFAAARDGLVSQQRHAALEDQRSWLQERNTRCSQVGQKAASPSRGISAMANCIAGADAERIRVLTGSPEAGPGSMRRPIPVFVRQAGTPGRTRIAVRVYRFSKPVSPAEQAVNALADKTLKDIPYKAVSSDEPPGAGGPADWIYEEIWTIAYASPGFLSFRRDLSEASGGAHGTGGTFGVTIDWAKGREVAFGDVFDKASLVALSRNCMKQIKEQLSEKGTDPGDDTAADAALLDKMKPVMLDFSHWVFTGAGATVFFNTETIGNYADGAYTCDLPIALLERSAKAPVR